MKALPVSVAAGEIPVKHVLLLELFCDAFVNKLGVKHRHLWCADFLSQDFTERGTLNVISGLGIY